MPDESQIDKSNESVLEWLLAMQDAYGRWGWHSLESRVALIRDHVTWQGCGPKECDDNGFFEGELEPCINGQVAMAGAYFSENVNAASH